MKKRVVSDVDSYLAEVPEPAHSTLQKLRAMIRAVVPAEATETISYQMPAFKLHGVLIYFAAWKHHLGLYPPVRGDERLEKAVAPYAGEKGNLQFPLDRPIPYGLIEQIVTLRVKQDQAKAATRKSSRRGAGNRKGSAS